MSCKALCFSDNVSVSNFVDFLLFYSSDSSLAFSFSLISLTKCEGDETKVSNSNMRNDIYTYSFSMFINIWVSHINSKEFMLMIGELRELRL